MMQRNIAAALCALWAVPAAAQDPRPTLALFPQGREVCFRAPQPGAVAPLPMAADVSEITLWSIMPPKGLTYPGKTVTLVGIDIARTGKAQKGSITAACTPDRGFLRCAVDCGGGSFALQAGLGGTLSLYNSFDGMRLQACALTGDASQSELLPPLRNAPPYTLYRLTDTDCAAFAARRTPKPE